MFSITSGEICKDILYKVIGEKGVTYNGTDFNTNETFRGVEGIKEFVFFGEGTALLIELTEIRAGELFFKQDLNDTAFPAEATKIKGMSINFELTEEEKKFNDVTALKGMALTFKDYPLYSAVINETRFSFNPD